MKWEIPVSIFCWGELIGFWLSEVTLSHPGGSQTVFFTFQDEIFPQTDRLHFSFLKMTVVKPFSKLTNYFLTVWGIFLALFILWISLNVCRFFLCSCCTFTEMYKFLLDISHTLSWFMDTSLYRWLYTLFLNFA